MQSRTWQVADTEPTVDGNAYDRYHSKNPIARSLMHGYLDTVAKLVAPLELDSLLDVGCGEGHLLAHIRSVKPNARCEAVDTSARMIELAQSSYPDMSFRVASAYELPYDDGAFDLVVATDLLQLLADPQRALREMVRVSRRYVLLSVPREPMWRALNLARLAYLDEWGNPPGHVQHYRRADFLNMVRGHLRLARVELPVPWVVVLGRKGV